LLVIGAFALMPAPSLARGKAWAVSVYAGPGSNDYFTHIVFGGKFKVEGPVAGIALSGNLADLGNGFMLVGEVQTVHYFFDTPTTALSVGLGVTYRFPLAPDVQMTIGFMLGPSYAIDPPLYATGGTVKRYPWLNYVGSEVAVGIPQWPRWDVTLRSYHRSGMYGMYAHDVDQGSMIGIGLRHRF